MIAPLRRRHRLTTTLLAIVVPVLYVVALAARPDEPVAELPAALAETPPGNVDNDFGELFTDPAIVVRSRHDGADWWIELDPKRPVVSPETLVYWTRSSATAGQLPEDAYLIGSLAGDRSRTFAMPKNALGLAGSLVLYSLGAQEVVASTRLPALGRAPAEQDPATETPAGEAPAETPAGDGTESES